MKIEVNAGDNRADVDAAAEALLELKRRTQATMDLVEIELGVQRTQPLPELEQQIVHELAEACLHFVRNTVGVSVVIKGIAQ